MKKLFLILLLTFCVESSLEAQWCGRPCLRDRYYQTGWVDDNSWFYGYTDINDYPYALPVNRYFNPRPCRSSQFNGNYTIRFVEQPQAYPACPNCNGYHG